jgi:hypothetical protein
MEGILFLLNSLGDDWHQRRTPRCYEHGAGYFQVTFIRDTPGDLDLETPKPAIHISYPLDHCTLLSDLAEARGSDLHPRLPKVVISPQWVYDDLKDVSSQVDANDGNTLFLKEGRFWTMRVRREEVSYDSRGRQMSGKTRLADKAYIEGHFPVRESSNWIRHTDMMLVDAHDLGPAVQYFARKFPFASIGNAEYALSRGQSVATSSFSTLRPGHREKAFLARPGWVDLRLVEPQHGDRMERIKLDDGRIFSVVSGYWIHPQAVSIMQENEIDGLIMDTVSESSDCIIRLF